MVFRTGNTEWSDRGGVFSVTIILVWTSFNYLILKIGSPLLTLDGLNFTKLLGGKDFGGPPSYMKKWKKGN